MQKRGHMKKNILSSKRKEFGQLIRKKRQELGLTLHDVAGFCNSPFGSLAAIERGEVVKIPMRLIHSLSVLYAMDYDQLCEKAERIPEDIYYKIVRNPQLFSVIRSIEV